MGKRLYLYDQTNKETRLEGIEQRYIVSIRNYIQWAWDQKVLI